MVQQVLLLVVVVNGDSGNDGRGCALTFARPSPHLAFTLPSPSPHLALTLTLPSPSPLPSSSPRARPHFCLPLALKLTFPSIDVKIINFIYLRFNIKKNIYCGLPTGSRLNRRAASGGPLRGDTILSIEGVR